MTRKPLPEGSPVAALAIRSHYTPETSPISTPKPAVNIPQRSKKRRVSSAFMDIISRRESQAEEKAEGTRPMKRLKRAVGRLFSGSKS